MSTSTIASLRRIFHSGRAEAPAPASFYGTAGDDTIHGTLDDDQIDSFDGNDEVRGGGGNNYISGGAGNDALHGDAGNDLVFGGMGVDAMYGGDGDDLVYAGESNYIDAVVDGGAGFDSLYYLYLDLDGYTFDDERDEVRLGNVVVGTMADFEVIGGGQGDDIIISDGFGHTYWGEGGDDTLIAGIGDETMYGGLGIDTADMRLWDGDYLYDMGTGLTNYGGELYLEFERVLMGDGDDTVIGTAYEDSIDGGRGADSMQGLGGSDDYFVDSTSDLVIEAAGGGGGDHIYSYISLTLPAEVEDLTLLGSARNGTGNALNNIIWANSADNTLNGGGGFDRLYGGAGDDTYIVESYGDEVTEYRGGGNDTVRASFNAVLLSHLENLTLTGKGGWSGTGNSAANLIQGNVGNNLLSGDKGADTLLGGGGADTLVGGNAGDLLDGGNGNDELTGSREGDSFVYRTGADRITDFADDVDRLLLDDALWGEAALSVEQVLAMARVVAGNVIFDFGRGNTLTVEGIAKTTWLADDIAFV